MPTLIITQGDDTKELVITTGIGPQGLSAYQVYLNTTSDDPVLTEAEWSEPPEDGSDATVTAENIGTALGYTPADAATNTGDQDLSGFATQSALAAETAAREAADSLKADKSAVQQANPPGMARMVSVKTTGNISIYGKSTTGYMAVRSWNGTVTIFGTGVATTQYSFNLAVPSSGAWSNSAPKEIFIWSCTAGNANQSGDLTYLKLNNNKLTSFDGTGLTSLGDLRLNSNSLTSFDGTGLTSLIYLYIDSNSLTSFDGAALTSVSILSLQGNSLTSFNGSALTSLNVLNLNNNSLTSFNGTGLTSVNVLYLSNNSLTSFDGSALTLLNALYLDDNNLTSFDGSALTSLTDLGLDDNNLTSFDGTGLTSLTYLGLRNNSLTSFDGAGLTSLIYLNLENNSLTSFDGAGLTSLTSLYLENNSLTALSMASSPDVEALRLENNSLDATALDAFYTSLGVSPGVLTYWYYPGIYVNGNPGTSGDDPSIAAANGHTVYGS